MVEILKYRVHALVLAGVFCFFNVGLPIIVAACPMSGKAAMHPSCCAMKTSTLSRSIVQYSDRSCCKSSIAAERNTTEFVQSNSQQPDLQSVCTGLIVDCSPCGSGATEALLLVGARSEVPPLVTGDLPVFLSSLLI